MYIYISPFQNGEEVTVKTCEDLHSLFKNIDNNIDLKTDSNFVQYFK